MANTSKPGNEKKDEEDNQPKRNEHFNDKQPTMLLGATKE